MPAAACTIWLSSHIWATLLKSWTVAECMSPFMRVAAPIAAWIGEITNDGFAENAVYHATCMTHYFLKRIKDDSEDYLTSEHDPKFLSNFCCSLCDVELSFRSEGRNSEKKVIFDSWNDGLK
jgi:hypothetical protein